MLEKVQRLSVTNYLGNSHWLWFKTEILDVTNIYRACPNLQVKKYYQTPTYATCVCKLEKLQDCELCFMQSQPYRPVKYRPSSR